MPKEDWLRVVLDRIDPALFAASFFARATALRPDAPDLIAREICAAAATALPASSRFISSRPGRSIAGWPAEGSTQRLVLTRGAVETKDNECAATLAILERLTLDGAFVTIDAIATNSTIAAAVTARGGDDVLAPKQSQPSLHAEVARDFDDPATPGVETVEVTDRITAASRRDVAASARMVPR